MDDSTRDTIILELTIIWESFQLFCWYTLKSILILNSDLEYLNTVNTMKHQRDIVTGVSWK